MRDIQCKCYKGSGYGYQLNDKQKINLCKTCEMNLLSEMKKQEVIENKIQHRLNDLILNGKDDMFLQSIIFEKVYHSKVSPAQEKRTLKALKEYREKHWDKSYKKYIKE